MPVSRLKVGVIMLTTLLLCFASMGGTLTLLELVAPGGPLATANN